MEFTIVTNRETANQIKQQCFYDERLKHERTYVLGEIKHNDGFSEVQIKAKNGIYINPSDIFFLGHFSASLNG